MDDPNPPNIESTIENSLSTIEEAEELLKSAAISSDQKPLGVKKKVEETSSKLTDDEIPLTIPRKVNKVSMIDSILELQEKVDGFEPKPKSYYMKKKVPEIEAILGDLLNRSVDKLNSPNGVAIGPKVIVENEKGEKIDPENANSKGSALFQFNMLFAYFLELGSVNYESQMGVTLRGLTEDITTHKKALEESLNDIYREHHDVLDPYLTPTNKYFLLMGGIISNRLIINRQKKSSDSSDPQPSDPQEDGEQPPVVQ